MSEQRNFKDWLKFFEKNEPSLTRFIYLLSHKDTYFLNHPLEVDFEHELYEKIKPGGFMEQDFQHILSNQNPKNVYYKTRLAIALGKNIDFSLVKERIGVENFTKVLELTLVDGHYEKYGITFEKLIGNLITKKILPRESLIDVAFLRGVNLGSREMDMTEKELKKFMKINQIKSVLGF